eukprot:COSAG05_NODE_1296_length_5247_cov_2.705517_1_plen_181_part_00
MWLKELEFDRVDPYATLLVIFVMCYVFRLLTWRMLLWRERITMKLTDITDYHEVNCALDLLGTPLSMCQSSAFLTRELSLQLFGRFGLSDEARLANAERMTVTPRRSITPRRNNSVSPASTPSNAPPRGTAGAAALQETQFTGNTAAAAISITGNPVAAASTLEPPSIDGFQVDTNIDAI